MNRDALLATIIGFILGLIITSIVIAWPKISASFQSLAIKMPSISKNVTPDIMSPQAQPKEKQTVTDSQPLTITGPVTDSIAESDTLLVSGSATIGSYVIIGGLLDEAVAIASEDGTYSGSISLQEGKNPIEVSTFTDGVLTTKTVEVYYVQK